VAAALSSAVAAAAAAIILFRIRSGRTFFGSIQQ
jgi:hypothetical protein